MGERLTHIDEEGRARMVDVGGKPATAREALARGRVRMRAETLARALAGDAPKGDVRAVAEIAGVMAGKRAAELIPLCHPIALSNLIVTVAPDETLPGFAVTARARASGQTGVEMEALTAVAVACLTLYDMLKAIDRDMAIEEVCLAEKHGGASGSYTRTP
ncbi:MAG TPA: cyclic pyranopterin monophosphate synthase MoaC [Caulobacterales bacterium]|nr:cyclic pyranopterin monophosphate synthase MoaC [Caulobacterales bacterium]